MAKAETHELRLALVQAVLLDIRRQQKQWQDAEEDPSSSYSYRLHASRRYGLAVEEFRLQWENVEALLHEFEKREAGSLDHNPFLYPPVPTEGGGEMTPGDSAREMRRILVQAVLRNIRYWLQQWKDAEADPASSLADCLHARKEYEEAVTDLERQWGTVEALLEERIDNNPAPKEGESSE